MIALPHDFSDLGVFVPHWACATEQERLQARLSADMQQIESFYQTMTSRLEAIIGHLNQSPLQELPPAEQTLLNLALAYMEAAMCAERFHSPRIEPGFDPDRFLINDQPATRPPHDR